MTPTVSIITPTYNHENFIGQCIKSVLAQTNPDWEMIIINDGSTDQTFLNASKFAAIDNRIRLIDQPNRGVFRLGEIYNKALEQCTGKYIAILEGDDMWDPRKLERQVSTLDSNNEIILTWCKAEMVNEDASKVYEISPARMLEKGLYANYPLGSILELYWKGQFIPAVTIMIRRSGLEKIGGFIQAEKTPLVDFTTVMELSLHGKFYFDNIILGKWRIYSTQTTKRYPVEIYSGILNYLKGHLPRINYMDESKKKEILHHYKMLCLVAYARSGRYRLIRREFRAARKDYWNAVVFPESGKWTWRLRAIVGIVFSYLHLNVEGLARSLGKKTYLPK